MNTTPDIDEKAIRHDSSETARAELVSVEDAKAATAKEHSMTVRQGLRAYPRAIMWSILLSSAVIMEGYDTILVGSRLNCRRPLTEISVS